MAKLSEFLGGLVSSVSDARAKSDIQAIKIAKEYVNDKLLQHFAVPRMRIDKVEINIPVAIDKLIEKKETVYEPIDNQIFSSIAYKQILKSLAINSLNIDASKTIRTSIAENVNLLEAKIKANQAVNALEDFSKNIALKVIEITNSIYTKSKRKPLSNDALLKLENTITNGLYDTLKNEIKTQSIITSLDSPLVIVEAEKLREVKPENIIMIKMTISEQGMEWVNMENIDGNINAKLMPE